MKAILVTGASGSGTSTLAASLAADIGGRHVEADDFLWHPTEPPYTRQRSSEERLGLAIQALNSAAPVVLAGSIVGWGSTLEDSFELIVFLVVETEIRLERIAAREMRRFGRVDPEFLAWAAQYELGPREGRSLAKHRAWLASRSCPVITLKGAMTIEDQMAAVHARAAEVAAMGSRAG